MHIPSPSSPLSTSLGAKSASELKSDISSTQKSLASLSAKCTKAATGARGLSKNALADTLSKNLETLIALEKESATRLVSPEDCDAYLEVKDTIDNALKDISEKIIKLREGMTARRPGFFRVGQANLHIDLTEKLSQLEMSLTSHTQAHLKEEILVPGRYDKRDHKDDPNARTVIVGSSRQRFELLGVADKKGVIGQGTMGKVRYARTSDGTLVAVKKVSIGKGETADGRSRMSKEAFIDEALTGLKIGLEDPNLLGACDYLVTTDHNPSSSKNSDFEAKV